VEVGIMRDVSMTCLSRATMLVAVSLTASSVLPPQVRGQEPSKDHEACTVTLAPEKVDAGLAAVRVEAFLSEAIGTITDLETAEESGIVLTSPERLERIQLGRSGPDGQRPRSIEMARETDRAVVYLNLVKARPGSYSITMEGQRGSCRGTLTVNGPLGT